MTPRRRHFRLRRATYTLASVVNKKASTTTTAIHDASHTVVTTVTASATEHDFVTVAPSPAGGPTPTGKATVSWFLNGTCNGTAASTSGNETLSGGSVDATDFAKSSLTPGSYSFMAHYAGDGNYLAWDGACEPLQVVTAKITITPASATNMVGQSHTMTVTLSKDTATGTFVPA